MAGSLLLASLEDLLLSSVNADFVLAGHRVSSADLHGSGVALLVGGGTVARVTRESCESTTDRVEATFTHRLLIIN